ncbi:MAG: Glycosyl transferase GT2 family [Parcubacteria group bacterium GW2011_GWC1_38_6]|nr:MAG: Glycosyl transferase GT2 family [Parcubacteria group bacterium GW2011_GWC1_38_6]
MTTNINQIKRISVIVPVYNEAGNIIPLHKEIKDSLASIKSNIEIIYVNDGSTDDSLIEMCSLQDVSILDLNRNYGQSVALDAGFKAATGEIIVTLDGDGQNDPCDIPHLLQKFEEDHLDVVAGWRKKRNDPWNIRFITDVARFFRRLIIGDIIHDSGCTLRVYRRAAVKSLDIGGEMHRYILALLKWKGFRIGELEVNHRLRTRGRSNYGSSKAFRGLIDLVYIWFIHKYSDRPVHLFGYMGLTSLGLAGLSLFWSLYEKIMKGLSLNRNGWFFIGSFFFLAGIIFFSFGIVIDIVIRMQLTLSPNEKRYYIREIIKK